VVIACSSLVSPARSSGSVQRQLPRVVPARRRTARRRAATRLPMGQTVNEATPSCPPPRPGRPWRGPAP
jgi:hypothetical protein